ncbi:MAG: SDR family oxidoreductase [Pseudomonadota bacterium]
MKLFLCLGYGYTAQYLAPILIQNGWRVFGTTRSDEKVAQLREKKIEAILWSDKDELQNVINKSDAILVSPTPDENGCPAFLATNKQISQRAREIQWIGYLSSNGVYGDHTGAWIDEDTIPTPSGARGERRLKAEGQWRQLSEQSGVPVFIFRLPGIYGPGRSAFERLKNGTATRVVKPGQVFSRAHVEDIAAAVLASLQKPDAGRMFNIADDEPAPPQDVTAYAAELLGIEPPPETPLNDATLSPMARSFWADNKRVRNTLMKSALGVELKYPTYREGLRAILEGQS